MVKELDGLLYRWGDWLRQGNHVALGYGTSPLKKMIDGAPRAAYSPDAGLESDPVAEWVEQEVCNMGKFRPDWVEAMRSRYVHQKPVEGVADHLKLSRTQANHVLREARIWMAARLLGGDE